MHRRGARSWDDEAFRDIDASLGALVRQLARAVAAIFVAYATARVISEAVLRVDDHTGGFVLEGIVMVVCAGVALYFSSGRPIRRDLMAQRQVIAENEASMRDEVSQQRFVADLQNALDMVDAEPEALGIVGEALALAVDGPAELLLADSSRAHLRVAAAAPGRDRPGCRVETPRGCPAVRRGQSLLFESTTEIATCPKLRERATASALSAVCMPVMILGTPTGVIHATAAGGDEWQPVQIRALEALASQAGSRVGVLRAMSQSKLQATTDSLTGLLNRRELEERMRALRDANRPFAVAFVDLDHFKALNDTYGHDTGDRALRTFARVLQQVTRDGDLASRYGGEEFVVVLVDADALSAAPVVHRIREELAAAVGSAHVPPFTASIGVADSTYAADMAGVIRAADAAMFQAKQQGRDRIVIADGPTESAEVTLVD